MASDLSMRALNHDSGAKATMVYGLPRIFTTMVAYKDRLALAMQLAGASPHDLAKALGITYTGAMKALSGGKDGTSAMSAINNSKAAKLLGVDPDWLATGDGSTAREPVLALTPQERATILAIRVQLAPDSRQDTHAPIAQTAPTVATQDSQPWETASKMMDAARDGSHSSHVRIAKPGKAKQKQRRREK
jgi:hypothetical protein